MSYKERYICIILLFLAQDCHARTRVSVYSTFTLSAVSSVRGFTDEAVLSSCCHSTSHSNSKAFCLNLQLLQSDMSLRDTACYTLTINATPDPNMVELVELSTMPTPTPTRDTRYVRVKESREEEAYSGVIYGKCCAEHDPQVGNDDRTWCMFLA